MSGIDELPEYLLCKDNHKHYLSVKKYNGKVIVSYAQIDSDSEPYISFVDASSDIAIGEMLSFLIGYELTYVPTRGCIAAHVFAKKAKDKKLDLK